MDPQGSNINTFSSTPSSLGWNYNTLNTTNNGLSGSSPSGHGFGIDVGGTIELFQNLKLALAINDIGFVQWKGNIYKGKDTLVNNVTTNGFNSYQFINEAKKLISDKGLFTWEGIDKKNVSLPTNARLGASLKITHSFEIGADFFIPITNGVGNIQKALFGAGINVRLFKLLNASIGYSTGGSYGMNIPIGANITLGPWQFGIASRDIVTFFKQNNPTLSVVGGLCRFRFK